MDPIVFKRFRKLIYDKSGITLRDGKEALVESRIGARMRALHIETAKEYFEYVHDEVENQKAEHELVRLLDVISTNVTSFFRENDHFEFLSRFLAERLQAGQTRFRIWSAACSTGEEPYTIAMTATETLKGHPVDFKILATDISTRVLEEAKIGKYTNQKLGTIPPALRSRYFVSQGRDSEERVVADGIRNLVTFSRINLSKQPFPMKGPFDIIFCRNVMIYFDAAVRDRLVAEMHRLTAPGGYLFVGHSETLTSGSCPFRNVKPSIYRKETE